MADKKYEVGFCKPPAHTRFKKGVSGNPSGRPKRRITPAKVQTTLDKLLSARITITSNGRPRQVSMLEALLTQLVHKAVKGHQPAVSFITDIINTGEAAAAAVLDAGPSPEESMAEIDRVLDEMNRKLAADSGRSVTEQDMSLTDADPDAPSLKEPGTEEA